MIFPSILVLSTLILSSCRKKIEHIPSSITPIAKWRFVKTMGNTITSIEVFNNELYVAGLNWQANYYIPTLEKLDANYNLINFHNGIFSKVYSGSFENPSINKLYATSNRLYIGGNFKFDLNNATSLMYYDLNGNFTPIPLLTYSNEYISSLYNFQNEIIVGGAFESSPFATTDNIERLQNDAAAGLANFPFKVVSITTHADQLYAIGEHGSFKKWNGSTWDNVAYSSSGNSEYLYDICSYKDELYLVGDFYNNVSIKKLNQSGVWEYTGGISSIDAGKLKVIDNKLYVFGSSIYFNGKYDSQVISYDGNSWQQVGNIKAPVNNLVKFNGKLVCSTDSKLYTFE